MLFPKKVKHRKWQTNRKNEEKLMRPATRGTEISFGDFALVATTPSRVRSNQIEAARRVISRTIGKTGRIWIRIFPDKPITKKAAEVPMGKGKGDPDHFVFEVEPGRIIFEIKGTSEELAKEAIRKATAKLPLKSRFVKRAGKIAAAPAFKPISEEELAASEPGQHADAMPEVVEETKAEETDTPTEETNEAVNA